MAAVAAGERDEEQSDMETMTTGAAFDFLSQYGDGSGEPEFLDAFHREDEREAINAAREALGLPRVGMSDVGILAGFPVVPDDAVVAAGSRRRIDHR